MILWSVMPKQYRDEILLGKIVSCIKNIRISQGITQEVFYFDTGIHIARIEQGKTNITISSLAKICTYFETSLKDFFEILEKNE